MRALGLITGLDGNGFDVAMRNIQVRSTLTGTASVRGEDGRMDKFAAVSRRTEVEFDGFVEGDDVPKAGDVLAYGGEEYLVVSAALTAEKGRFQRYAVRAERSDEAEVSGLEE